MITSISADIMEKLKILSDAAKFDVACTSSGASRSGNGNDMGSAFASGICHSFTADGRCISLLKILFTNECIYDCKYCINRCTNDVERVTFTPEEVCNLTVEFYRRNYIEGLFLSSGIIESPEHTMQLLYTTLFLLRNKYHFNGYIHIKGIPGASSEVLEMIGYLCDRMSVNLELPTAEGLRAVAPNKARKNILTPMRFIQNGIKDSRMYHGNSSMKNRMYIDEQAYYEQMAEIKDSTARLSEYHRCLRVATDCGKADKLAEKSWGMGVQLDPGVVCETTDVSYGAGDYINNTGLSIKRPDRYYVPAGQSTQMIIGATGESDYTLLQTTQQLYQGFDLKRVFYSAYIPLNEDDALPGLGTPTPLLREHRLYQADWLLRYYGFQADELLSSDRPNFNTFIDPKCDWALRHLEYFPVEINQASYEQLLRVPGIGNKSAGRIVRARRQAALDFEDIKKMGVVLKRAVYFITCRGKMKYHTPIEEDFITRQLIGTNQKDNWKIEHPTTYRQLSLFDDFNLT